MFAFLHFNDTQITSFYWPALKPGGFARSRLFHAKHNKLSEQMSNAGSSSFQPQSSLPVFESIQKSTPTPVSFTTQNFSWSSASSSYAGPSTWHDRPIPTNVIAPANDTVVPSKSIKKKRTEDEEQVIEKTAARYVEIQPLLHLLAYFIVVRFAARLAADQAAVLHPDVDTPFSDSQDVINRLLPYHVFQQPQEDLAVVKGLGKGKRKATPEDELRNEIAGMSNVCYNGLRIVSKP